MLMGARTHALTRAAEAWKTLGSDFDKAIADFQHQVCDALDDETVSLGFLNIGELRRCSRLHTRTW